ncbi:hypothetical protein COCCADRAFT_94023 [Bipolaris zeicola 26-R-13]|uniref:Uncharacterized protein n=1 Tax=Cochliobolus carbonum (strain 26-R-13) TaxID=930089 RepID=W6Y9N6_COCC2|nr:uncharacterized protein COCCADRAFT_94023 [Bipolaris zeicola 26-R-13]EUC34230.1 hypothetical protein COCCADRAFT_94023 [Bipolaris zeicola 26-R-13]
MDGAGRGLVGDEGACVLEGHGCARCTAAVVVSNTRPLGASGGSGSSFTTATATATTAGHGKASFTLAATIASHYLFSLHLATCSPCV